MERVFKVLDLPRRGDIEVLNANLQRVAEAVESLQHAEPRKGAATGRSGGKPSGKSSVKPSDEPGVESSGKSGGKTAVKPGDGPSDKIR
jgi:hypothetical protein